MGWYTLFVKSGKENYVCNEFEKIMKKNGITFKTLIPKRKLMEYRLGMMEYVEKNLFPGYILFETEDIEKVYFLIKKNPMEHIYSVLRTEHYFQKVELQEIKHILALVNSIGIIEESIIFVENDKVCIKEGPLVNYTGIIEKINIRKKRAKIRIKFLNRICRMDICIKCIKHIDSNEIKKQIYFK